MGSLVNKKSILIIVICVIAVGIFVRAMLLHIPDLKDYNAQKVYAQKVENEASQASQWIFFSPNLFIGELLKHTVGVNSWQKSLEASEYLLKKYPEQANDDVDVFGWLGDSYDALKKPEKAREAYQKQLEIFKRKYYKKQYFERRKLSDEQALIEEVRYVIRAHFNIARTYNTQKKWKEALAEYDKTITYIDDLKDIRPILIYDIFQSPFKSRGKILKCVYKDYDGAVKNYELMKAKIPDSMAASTADIFIGDTYLAKGDIEKAKEIYKQVVDEYKNRPIPHERGNYDVAEGRLRELEQGKKIIAADGVSYEIKDGKVEVRYW